LQDSIGVGDTKGGGVVMRVGDGPGRVGGGSHVG
jgi:hypothetical protein